MAGFPPASNKRRAVKAPQQVTGERGPVSTGGGLKGSIAKKNKGTVNSPGVAKTNSAS